VVASVIGSMFVGTLTWETRTFLGDDLQVLIAFEDGKYLSSLEEVFRDTSLDKWRPLNNLFLYFSLQLFGNSYVWYWFTNTGLTVLLGIVVMRGLNRFHEENVSDKFRYFKLLAVLTIIASPFSFMPRIGVFGFLELMPIIAIVLSYTVFARASSVIDFANSASLALAAALIHERYLIFALAMAILGWVRSQRNSDYRGSPIFFFSVPLFHVYTTALVLEIDPFRGGGEEHLSSTAGRWMTSRFLDGFLFLFGGIGGKTVFYSIDSSAAPLFREIIEPSGVLGISTRLTSLIVALVFIMIGCVVPLMVLRRRKDPLLARLIMSSELYSGRIIEPFVISVALLIPAATVISRIEMRWLFASLVFLVLSFAAMANRLARFTVENRLMTACLGLLLLINLGGLRSFSTYNSFRENSYRLIDVADKSSSDLLFENYVLVVRISGQVGYLPWATADGLAIANEIGRPPKLTRFVHESRVIDQGFCQDQFQMGCIVIAAKADSITGDARFVIEDMPT
jgi:hypothetical protein